MAAIAACHAEAPSWLETDWLQILTLYDVLVRLDPSPVTHLNRAVALSQVEGPDAALTAVDDLAQAQALADAQWRTDWAPLLERGARQVNPVYDALFGDGGWPYYWSADQSEWATDVLFRSPAALAAAYPAWVR